MIVSNRLPCNATRRSGKTALMLLLFAALAAAVLLTVLLAFMMRPAVPVVPVPTPNAYDTLQQAGRMVRGLPKDYADTTDRQALASFLAENAMALTLVDRAYHQECVVPIDINVGMQAVLDSTDAIRQAMRLVHVNARAAALDHDRAREAMLYAKLFALSSKSANGGLMIHALSAAAYERRALERLRGIVGDLSAEEKRDVLAILEPVGRGPTDTEPILERERALSTAKLGPLRTWILWVTSRSSDAAVQRFIENDAAIVKLNDEVLKLLGQ